MFRRVIVSVIVIASVGPPHLVE